MCLGISYKLIFKEKRKNWEFLIYFCKILSCSLPGVVFWPIFNFKAQKWNLYEWAYLINILINIFWLNFQKSNFNSVDDFWAIGSGVHCLKRERTKRYIKWQNTKLKSCPYMDMIKMENKQHNLTRLLHKIQQIPTPTKWVILLTPCVLVGHYPPTKVHIEWGSVDPPRGRYGVILP